MRKALHSWEQSLTPSWGICKTMRAVQSFGTGVRRELCDRTGLYSQGMLEQRLQEDFLRTKCGQTERKRDGLFLILEVQRYPSSKNLEVSTLVSEELRATTQKKCIFTSPRIKGSSGRGTQCRTSCEPTDIPA